MTATKPIKERLSQELGMLQLRVCQAVNDRKRLMILYALRDGPRYVLELAQELDYPQPTVSRHLHILHRSGLILKERRGQVVYYSLSDVRILDALDLLRTILQDLTEEHARISRSSSLQVV